MKRRKRQRRLSLGTFFMLLFTFLVVLSFGVFLFVITGGEMAGRAGEVLAALSSPEIEESPAAQSVVASSAVSAALLTATQQPTQAPSPTDTPRPQPRTLTLAAAGTVYAPKAIRQTAEESGGQYDFEPIFSALTQAVSAADLAVVTLETTTAGSEKGYGNYNTPAQILDALRACGFDLISMATERALDKGYDGLSITLQEITRCGMFYAGVGEDASSASGATMLSIDGVQVAVLACSYGLSDEGKQNSGGDSRGALATMDLERLRSDVAKARMEGANLVVVLPHWGTKNKLETPESVRGMAKALAQAGADIILGTHPNVVQGVERILATRADGLEYETVVFYSLGSLLTDARSEENTAGMIAQIDVTYDPVTRRISLGEAGVTPVYIASTKESDAMVYRVVPAEDEEALAALDAGEQEAARRAAQIVRSAVGQEE